MPAQRAQTLEALTSGLGEPSNETRVDARLKDARKRLDNLLAALESGIEMRTLAPRIAAAQHVVDSLETLAATNTAARTVPTRDEIAPLLDETAASFGDLFNSESDPGGSQRVPTLDQDAGCGRHRRSDSQRDCRSHASPGPRKPGG